MTTTYKILGQICPDNGYQSAGTPGIWFTAYTVPASTQAIVRSIIISSNKNTQSGPITVALLPSGVSTGTAVSTSSSIISFVRTSLGSNVFKYHITMNAGDKIAVRHESTDSSYSSTITLSGVEIT